MLAYDDKHPKGTKYRPEELRRHRDNWFARVGTAHPADYTEEHRKLDQGLFIRMIRLLPWSGSIGFISRNNFGFSFDLRMLRDLNSFHECCEDPSWEFVDPTLETVRATLAEHISRFLILIAVNTFPTHNPNRNSVPEEWGIEQPEHFLSVIEDINGAARQCIDAYKALIREARHRLAIEVPLGDLPQGESET